MYDTKHVCPNKQKIDDTKKNRKLQFDVRFYNLYEQINKNN